MTTRVKVLLAGAAILAASAGAIAYHAAPVLGVAKLALAATAVPAPPLDSNQLKGELRSLKTRIEATPDAARRELLLGKFDQFEKNSNEALSKLSDQAKALEPIAEQLKQGEVPTGVSDQLVENVESAIGLVKDLVAEQQAIEAELEPQPADKEKSFWEKVLEWLEDHWIDIVRILVMIFGSGDAGSGPGGLGGDVGGAATAGGNDGVGLTTLAGAAMAIGNGSDGQHIGRLNGRSLTILPNGDVTQPITVELPEALVRSGVTLKDLVLPGAGIVEALFRGDANVDLKFIDGQPPVIVHGSL